MRLYIVISTLWDDYRIECVCDTRELAEQALSEFRKDLKENLSDGVTNYLIQEWELNKINLWTVEFLMNEWRAKRANVSFAHAVPEKLFEDYYVVRVEANSKEEAIALGKEIISSAFPEVS